MDKKALIIGNGFSINFDRSFANIYGALNKGKNNLLKLGDFDISLGAKPKTKQALKTNYSKVLNFVRNMNQSKLEKIFIDALEFAEFITITPEISRMLLDSKYIHKSKTAPNMVEITERIAKIGKEKGIHYVNIENWPVLFWIYNLVDRTPEFIEFNKSPNLFITLMKLGETVVLFDPNTPGSVMPRTRSNGFAIFYRLLMISIVFNEGKSVDIYDEDAKETFNSTWEHIIEKIYSKTMDYAQSIEINYLDSKDLLKDKFFVV